MVPWFTLRPPALELIEQEGLQDSSLGPGPLASTICLPDAIAHDQNLPSLPPLYMHTASNQILEWEQPGNKAKLSLQPELYLPHGQYLVCMEMAM